MATRRRRDLRGWAFVAPFMVVFVAMIIAPVVYALYLSFFRYKLNMGVRYAATSSYISLNYCFARTLKTHCFATSSKQDIRIILRDYANNQERYRRTGPAMP